MSNYFFQLLAILHITGLFALTILFIYFAVYYFKVVFYNEAPFIPTLDSALSEITTALALDKNSVLYDLGCGDGRILKAAISKIPDARGIGIDKNWLPVFLARLKNRKLKVQIIQGDFFELSLVNATHIYCYLFTNVLKKLEPKILSECKPGTRIVTCDFLFPNLIPQKEIPLPATRTGLSQKLYVYQI